MSAARAGVPADPGRRQGLRRLTAVNHVSLDIAKGEIFALLGSSGCGKSTLLRMLAGFETPTSGRIMLDGQDLAGMPPYERPMNMMFQSYALFPHLTVWDNIAFGLRRDGMPKDKVAERVEAMLKLVQLGKFAKRKPHQLSGGQQQRVALARSLAKQPQLLLLDEPLGALDKKLREETQIELVNIIEQVGVTCVMVTHDQEEAMTMASRIAVMSEGRFLQVGAPADIYETPATRFVADFIGNVNLMDGTLERGRARPRDHRLRRLQALRRPRHHRHRGMAVSVALRPEKIALTREAPRRRPRSTRCRARSRRCPTSAASPSTTSQLASGARAQGQPDQHAAPPRRRADLGRRGLGALVALGARGADAMRRGMNALRSLARLAGARPHGRHRRALPVAAGVLPAAVPDRRCKISVSEMENVALQGPAHLQGRPAAADAEASATTSSSRRTRCTSRPTCRSLKYAAVTTVLCLAIGYPFAYFMARAKATVQPALLMLVMLPFWTSFLLRVYAWKGLLSEDGWVAELLIGLGLDQLLLAAGLIPAPGKLMNTPFSLVLGMTYTYLPFMILPLYAQPGQDGPAPAGSRGRPRRHRLGGVLEDHGAAVQGRHHRRLDAGLHSLRRRVRHPRAARRPADADDRPRACGTSSSPTTTGRWPRAWRW